MKAQSYRARHSIVFFKSARYTANNNKGVIAVRKQHAFEFATTRGIKPSSTDSFTAQGETFILHGGYDGYVYRQESGNTFDGTNIIGRYRSPDMTMGDAGIRKNFQRVIINYSPTGTLNSDLFLRYDYESPDAARPAAYPFDSSTVVALYGTSLMAQRHMVVSLIHL